ncbi:hypothetical protein Q9L42_009790 [Methylomarinum sp. Ch1-1]|uniref:Quinohemoprotein amine dehydrogenase alpha subunit haem binding domain-containing protein n=1 Tax=Methylomarinum roseum TaxID=3067653 RepID=A0AAU7NZM9_9GAMM|nr:hypothetical protein [Methylomarinum sp. Ch1-1]MDP4521463.1 hypothetical protein [Methylomarinum sp. Ch1-1]
MKVFASLMILLTLWTPYRVQAQQTLDAETGLIVDEGIELIKTYCLACHSAKLIVQNRATLEGWREAIRWMQDQGLQKFKPETEARILKYLSENYSPDKQGRRSPLIIENWYRLN